MKDAQLITDPSNAINYRDTLVQHCFIRRFTTSVRRPAVAERVSTQQPPTALARVSVSDGPSCSSTPAKNPAMVASPAPVVPAPGPKDRESN